MNTTTKDSSQRSGEPWEQRVNREIGQAVNQIEQETQRLITYLNDEVVPQVREQSTSALRIASEKLKEFADYLDNQKRRS